MRGLGFFSLGSSDRCALACALGCIAALASLPASAEDASVDPPAPDVPEAFDKADPTPKPGWGVGEAKSWWVPAVDIVGFQVLLNIFDRHVLSQSEYGVDFDSIERNFKGDWVYDNDAFSINQIGHPYQGSIYHTAARSAGHGYWTSLAYTTVGSAVWEIAGETTPPSVNDQYTTTFAGSFLGEALFRLSSLVLENARNSPGPWREVAAAALSPSTGFNRLAYGSRFDGVFASRDPAIYTRIYIGGNLNADVDSDVNRNPDPEGERVPQDFQRGEASADLSVAYGIPGKSGYTYDRPFDYFDFRVTAVTSNALESVSTHGLLYGAPYAAGDDVRGIWGLYGMYDYFAPQVFRVSSTGLGVGTTAQWWVGEETALQGQILAGVGYGSAGSIRGEGNRDYHHGVTPAVQGSLRWIFGDFAALEIVGGDWYVTDQASSEADGTENLARIETSLTFRVHKLHGITLKYVYSRRDAEYRDLPDTEQSVSAISIGYTLLGHSRFGAVEWRPGHRHGS
jgi:hypothetical protein